MEWLIQNNDVVRDMKSGITKEQLLRIPIYIYRRQLNEIDAICSKERVNRRLAFFEAFQLYIADHKTGER